MNALKSAETRPNTRLSAYDHMWRDPGTNCAPKRSHKWIMRIFLEG